MYLKIQIIWRVSWYIGIKWEKILYISSKYFNRKKWDYLQGHFCLSYGQRFNSSASDIINISQLHHETEKTTLSLPSLFSRLKSKPDFSASFDSTQLPEAIAWRPRDLIGPILAIVNRGLKVFKYENPFQIPSIEKKKGNSVIS